MLLAVLGNIILHECGHIYMLRRYGVCIRKMTIGLTGFCIVCNMDYLARYSKFFCAAAGPFWGLCGAFVSSVLGNLLNQEFFLLFSGVGVILSLFNIIPVNPLDGGRMLMAAVPAVAYPVSVICGIGILIFGIYVMYCGYGTMLACLGIYLLFCVEKSDRTVWRA